MQQQQERRDYIIQNSPGYCSVTSALLRKNFIIIWANIGRYFLIYISPFLILLLILLLQAWMNSSLIWQKFDPPIYEVPEIPKCYGEDCKTLAYTIYGKQQPYINHTIDYIKKANHLGEDDVEKLQLDPYQVMDYLERFPNKTQSIVVFCTNQSWKIQDSSIPCYAEDFHLNTYTIIFNLSLFHRVPFFSDLKLSYPKDMTTIRLKTDLDKGIINYYNPQAEVNITVTEFPSKTSRFLNGISIASQYGSFFIMIPYLILLVMEGSQLLKNKQNRLRIGLNIVGVTHFQFYISEMIAYFFHVFVITVVFCISGQILDIKYFSDGILWFNFLTLFMNGIIVGLIPFCVTAAVNNKGLGMSFLYGFVLYSIVMQWLFTGGIILQLLYMDTARKVVKLLKIVFNLYPSFHFSKIFSDVSNIVDQHLDTFENRYIEGRPYEYDDLFVQKSQSFTIPTPHSYTLPSSLQSFFYLALTSLLYLLVLILLDRCVQSNRGYTQPFCPNLRKRKKSLYGDLQDQDQKNPVVKIVNLQKTYNKQTFAVRGVSLSLKEGEIVSLLGQNGAGKSTLINILIGALSMTKGQVLIDEKDIRTQIDEVRKILGVCPQFDILWEDMTAYQHMLLFTKLKGCNPEGIQSGLQAVSLWENRNGQVKTFSGGMRRRLSLAISLIGDPKLVVLDEPTTGMDAKIRFSTWKIILQLRGKRTVLLTTHNMQQAECVSDKILIMSKGRVVARGTNVQLKNQYGQGYIIKGIDPETKEEVEIKCKEQDLQNGLKEIYERKLQGWSLQQTTLEEVFLNINNRY